MYECLLEQESALMAFANQVAACLNQPIIIGLQGDIGAGKTTFVRALLRALGIKGAIKSPTYAIMETYQSVLGTFYHVDLYRLQDEAELALIGFRDIFDKTAFCCIEWPENAPSYQSYLDILMRIDFMLQGRKINLQALTPYGNDLLTCLAKKT